MVAFLSALLVGCAPTPASIKIEGADVTVNKVDAVAIPKATVLDAEKKAIEPQPTLTWKVEPATVAKLDGTKVVPVANGTAKVTATLDKLTASYNFTVALPDAIEVAGYTAGTPIPAGGSVKLTAKVKSGDKEVPGMTVTWASDNEAVAKVDKDGNVTTVAEGTANIKATLDKLNSTVAVTVGAAAAAADAAAPAEGGKDKPAGGKPGKK